MVDNMSKRGFDPLTYKYQGEEPEPGSIKEVAAGVYWVRMPMWGRLNHINVWLLRDDDAWTIVDTGLDRKSTRLNSSHSQQSRMPSSA